MGYYDEETKQTFFFNHYKIEIQTHLTVGTTDQKPTYTVVGVVVRPERQVIIKIELLLII